MYNPFEYIDKRPLKVRPAKRPGRYWIKTNGQRVNLETRNHHSNTDTGKTYIFSEDGQQVKQVNNYI